MTDELFIKWLKDSGGIRCVLMEVVAKVAGVETTRFLSSKGYVTKPADVPANTHYQPIIAGSVKFTESLPLEGSSVNMSFGDIEIDNLTGERDEWLDDIWANRAANVYIGDVRWPRSDFRLIFSGVVVGIDSKNAGRLNLKLGDKLQRLNTVVSEVKLLGSTPNKDNLIPLCFGECHNVSPLLVDATVNEYQVHNGPIESIIEVRDNGVPVLFTPFLSTGKFRLTSQPVGVVTCSVQGDKPSAYANDIASTIKRLVIGFGQLEKRFIVGDIDSTSFDAFALANPQPIGLYIRDRANVLDCVTKLAGSVGGRLTVNRAGKLALVVLTLPRPSAGRAISASDMVERSLALSQYPTVVAGVKLGYCKNYTVQDNLQTGIPQEHVALFKDEWLTVTRTDSVAAVDYVTYTEPTLEETQLLTASDATAEANRRLSMVSTQRKVFRYTGLAHLMLEELGGSQTITHKRYGLVNGATGQIVSVATDWLNPHSTIEVMI
jgi:hypothetical protein